MGGSDIKFGVTNLTADRVLLPELVKLPSLTHEGPTKTISQILAGMEAMLAKLKANWAEIADIAVTVPCPCSADGVILEVTNLGTPETKHLWEVPFGDLLAEAVAKQAGCTISVFACNDANAAGQDDDYLRFGLKKDPRTSVFITTGTGLGGCVLVNGSVLFGRGQAGELGHLKLAIPEQHATRFAADPYPPCGCGGNQCVEARASLTSLVRRVPWALTEVGTAVIAADLEARGQTLDAEVLQKLRELAAEHPKRAAYEVRTFADQQEDPFCRWLLEDWAIMIGALFASIAPVLHPDLFIVGGGLTEMSSAARQWFLHAVQKSYDEINAQRCFDSSPDNCRIVWSESADQGWRGAILMGMRAHGE